MLEEKQVLMKNLQLNLNTILWLKKFTRTTYYIFRAILTHSIQEHTVASNEQLRVQPIPVLTRTPKKG